MTSDSLKKTIYRFSIFTFSSYLCKQRSETIYCQRQNISSVRRIIFFLALSIAQMVAAQPAVDTAFKTLGIADGLRSNSVTSVLSDSRGYLWIGTYQGLNRYDGHQVKTRFPESGDPSFYDGRSG